MQEAAPVVRVGDCLTIRELNVREDLDLVTDSQDVRETKRNIGPKARGYGGFLVRVVEGEVREAYGFVGNIPLLDKLACRVR